MRFALDADQLQLRDAVRRLLAGHSSSEQVRRAIAAPPGYDRELWRRMAQELGLHGIAVPERFGGSGAGTVELAVVAEELGRALTPGPFLSTVVLAAGALLESGDDAACERWLPGIVAGDTVATLAVLEEPADWDFAGIAVTATPAGKGWTIDGRKTFVTDGHTADLVLVLAMTADGPGLFAVETSAAEATASALDVLDPTRAMSVLSLAAAPARLVGTPGEGLGIVRRTLDRAAVVLAAEQVGGTARCLEMAVEYAKARVQFGRPIGSFQAIKHMLADVLLETESASAAAYYAAWTADQDPGGLSAAASLCRSFCSDAFVAAAAANVQVHGGIGFTWEHDAHLYLKRANTSKELFGSPTLHRERLSQAMLEASERRPVTAYGISEASTIVSAG